MGDVIKFRRRPRNRGQFRGQGSGSPGAPQPGPKRPRQRKSKKQHDHVRLLLSAVVLSSLAGLWWSLSRKSPGQEFACPSTRVIDGDTFDCGEERIRLQGIDAPEMPGHCRPGRECIPGDPYASTEGLQRLLSAGAVECRKKDTDAYGRTVARCTAAGKDLSCGQLDGGFAVRRYGFILCL